MMSTFKISLLFIFYCFATDVSFAQNKPGTKDAAMVLKSGIKVIAKSYGDSIVLRWAPMRPWAWHKLNNLGYKIERIDVSEKDNPRREWLTTVPLKPFTLERFKTTFIANNNNAAIAAQCLYGKNFDTNLRPGQAGIEDKANLTDARYGYTLMVADYDAGVGVAVALRFTDKKVTKGAVYIYRIVSAAAATQGTIDTGTVLITNTPVTIHEKPGIKEAFAADRLSELHWDRESAETWSGFYVERSDDGQSFKPLNSLPFISSRPDSAMSARDSSRVKIYAILETQHIYIDSLPQNYKTYSYRIRGINAFAELSDYSNTVTVSGKDMTAPAAVNILNPKFISDRKMQVPWNKPVIEKDCKGYYVTRAHNINGPYETLNQQILAPNATEFTDDNAFAHGGTYYIIITVDTANNISSSSPAMGLVPDNKPPATPSGLKGRIDRNGLVYLSWNANKEEDVKGYKIYFANAPDHVFTQVTTEPDSLSNFVDSITIKTLTKKIWYKIVAVDLNNNHSEYSEPLQLKKPDIIAPTPPIARNVMVSDKKIEMDWIQSSSDDAVGYIIYRQAGKNERSVIGRFRHLATAESFHFVDTTANANIEYSYTAVAIDEDSLHSLLSVPVAASIHEVPERPSIKTLQAVYDTKTKMVQLNWYYEEIGDYFFILYRSSDTDPLQRIQSVNKGQKQFIDYKIVAGKAYKYAIQAVYKDGNGNTRIGEPAIVDVKQ